MERKRAAIRDGLDKASRKALAEVRQNLALEAKREWIAGERAREWVELTRVPTDVWRTPDGMLRFQVSGWPMAGTKVASFQVVNVEGDQQ